jgi:hypothetical protein
VEADLQRFYQVDYRTRWTAGPGRLTLRRLMVLVRHLPAESATVQALNGGHVWSLGEVLLADVWQATARSKTRHPLLVEAQRHARRVALPSGFTRRAAAARARARARRERIAAGEIASSKRKEG